MTHTVEMVEGAEHIKIVFTGEMSKKDHEAGRDAAVVALTENGFSRLLVDASSIDARMPVSDDF